MSTYWLVILIVVGAIFLVWYYYKESFYTFLVGMGAILVSLSLSFFIIVSDETVNTSEPVEQRTDYQLVQINIGEHGFYVEQTKDKIQYVYMEDDRMEVSDVPINKATFKYDDSDPHLVMVETTQTYYRQWWIFYGPEETKTSREYEFHIPSRDYISFAFEK